MAVHSLRSAFIDTFILCTNNSNPILRIGSPLQPAYQFFFCHHVPLPTFLMSILPRFELKIITAATADVSKIPQVRRCIQLQRIVSRVAAEIYVARQHRDVVRRDRNAVARTNVVLWADVHKVQQDGRQAWDGVVLVGYAVRRAQSRRLICDVV
jgi:hypothetical protein